MASGRLLYFSIRGDVYMECDLNPEKWKYQPSNSSTRLIIMDTMTSDAVREDEKMGDPVRMFSFIHREGDFSIKGAPSDFLISRWIKEVTSFFTINAREAWEMYDKKDVACWDEIRVYNKMVCSLISEALNHYGFQSTVRPFRPRLQYSKGESFSTVWYCVGCSYYRKEAPSVLSCEIHPLRYLYYKHLNEFDERLHLDIFSQPVYDSDVMSSRWFTYDDCCEMAWKTYSEEIFISDF